MVYLKTLIFTVLAPGNVTAIIPYFLSSIDRLQFDLGAFKYAGIPLMIAGAVGYLWCAFEFAHRGGGTPAPIDPPKKFVAVGLYRYVRNPMYVSIGLLLIGETVYLGRGVLLIYALASWFIFHSFVILYEESTLKKKFGSEYENYLTQVPRWVPKCCPGASIQGFQ